MRYNFEMNVWENFVTRRSRKIVLFCIIYSFEGHVTLSLLVRFMSMVNEIRFHHAA